MSGSRSPSPVLRPGSVSLRVADTKEEAHAQPPSNSWWSWFKKNIYENGCEANAIFWGTATWVFVYYLRDQFRNIDEDHETVGYALHNVTMGVLSNAVTALISLLKSRLEEGAFSWAALKDALAYVLIYLPLDGSYQAVEDYVIAINQSLSFDATHFEKYADVTLERNEVLAALAFFGVGYSGVHYLMNKIMHKPASIPKSFLVGAQYVTFFGTDYCFDVELSPSVGQGLLGLVYSSGTVALTALATNVTYDAIEASCYPPQQSAVEIEVVEENLENDYVKLNDEPKEQVATPTTSSSSFPFWNRGTNVAAAAQATAENCSSELSSLRKVQ
jgi:hypothetical protein